MQGLTGRIFFALKKTEKQKVKKLHAHHHSIRLKYFLLKLAPNLVRKLTKAFQSLTLAADLNIVRNFSWAFWMEK